MPFQTLELSEYDGKPIQLVKFALPNNTTYAYTTHWEGVSHQATDYAPLAGLDVENIVQDAVEQPGDVRLRFPFDNPVAEFYRTPVSPLNFSVEVYIGHEDDTDFRRIFTGFVIGCDWQGNKAQLTMATELALLQQLGLFRTFSARCQNQLGDADTCTVDLESYKLETNVSEVAGDILEIGAAGTFADGYFTAGVIQRVSNGDWRAIVGHTGTQITLLALFIGLTAGEAVKLYAGCDHRIATCATKFNNAVNCACFPAVPRRNPVTQKIV